MALSRIINVPKAERSSFPLAIFYKQSSEVLDYTLDFTAWLESGDAIASASVAVTSGTVTIDSNSTTDTTIVVWVSGGDDADDAIVTVTAVTDDSRTKIAKFRIKVKD